MRENVVIVDVGFFFHDLGVLVESDTGHLNVVDGVAMFPNLLEKPDSCRVADTQIPESRNGNVPVVWDFYDPLLFLSGFHLFPVVRANESGRERAQELLLEFRVAHFALQRLQFIFGDDFSFVGTVEC